MEEWLDRRIDRRLVRTFFLALVAIVRLRHSRSGLLSPVEVDPIGWLSRTFGDIWKKVIKDN